MSTYQRIFKQALAEGVTKEAFVPMAEAQEQQAAGPGGMPVDPAAGGAAPMDPMAAGGAPPPPGGDPMAAAGGGMPPPPTGDPAAGGMPMPPLPGGDPAAGGLPPLPEGGLPPLPEEGGEGGDASVSGADAQTVEKIQQNTMDIVRQSLEMVGKAKPQEQAEGDAGSAPETPDPAAQPGPVTGQPGFDPATISGPLNL